MRRLREWLHGWLCEFDRHEWVSVHPAIWNGSYVRCAWCWKRDVHGGDRYGPHAWLWIYRGAPPPRDWTARMWGPDEWDQWQLRCQREYPLFEEVRAHREEQIRRLAKQFGIPENVLRARDASEMRTRDDRD